MPREHIAKPVQLLRAEEALTVSPSVPPDDTARIGVFQPVSPCLSLIHHQVEHRKGHVCRTGAGPVVEVLVTCASFSSSTNKSGKASLR